MYTIYGICVYSCTMYSCTLNTQHSIEYIIHIHHVQTSIDKYKQIYTSVLFILLKTLSINLLQTGFKVYIRN